MQFCHAAAGVVQRKSVNVDIVVRQVSDVCQGVARIMDPDSALRVCSCVQQCRLYVKMRLLLNQSESVRGHAGAVTSLDLVDEDPILIKHRAQHQVLCFIFDDVVSIGRCLSKPI